MSCAMDNPLYCRIDCTTDRSLHESRTRLERSNESPEARVKKECGVKILRGRFAPSKPVLRKNLTICSRPYYWKPLNKLSTHNIGCKPIYMPGA